jgi:hypothetical protein
MAELLIVVVAVVVLLMYVADRIRKLRTRARQMSGMNDRLDAAAAKVDAQQQQKRAVVRASAELTSVMPAIKRPPLTIPGMAGHGDTADEPDGEAAPEAVRSAEKSPSAGEVPATGAGQAAGAGSPVVASATADVARPAGAGSPAEAGSAEAGSPAEARDRPDRHDPPDAVPAPSSAERVAAPPAPRLADDTLSMPAGVAPDDVPVPKIQVTSEGTLIMRPVPDQGPAPADEALLVPDGVRDEPAAGQERINRR